MKEQGAERELRLLVRHLGVLARRAVRDEKKDQEAAAFWHTLIRNILSFGTMLLLGAVLDRLLLSL